MAGTTRKIVRLVDKGLGPATVALLAAHDRLRPSRAPLAPGAAPEPPASILVIKLVGLGDTVLMLTPLRRLRECFPEARIIALATPLSAGVLAGQPALDEVIVFDALRLARDPLGPVRLVRHLKDRRFDCVIDFEQHFQLSAAIAYLTGAARRIGFCWDQGARGRMFTDPVPLETDRHMVESFSRLLGPLGIPFEPFDALEKVAINREDQAGIDRWLAGHGIANGDLVIAVHPGSGPRAPHRRWDKSKFAEITRRLGAELGAKVVLTGTAEERALVREVRSLAGTPGVLDAAGEFSIGQVAALAGRCDLVLSNDTGTMHVAAAMGVPTVGLFGPESPTRYGPFGQRNRSVYKHLPCSPCIEIHRGRHRRCGDAQCMGDIGVEEVWAVIEGYDLKGARAGRAGGGRPK